MTCRERRNPSKAISNGCGVEVTIHTVVRLVYYLKTVFVRIGKVTSKLSGLMRVRFSVSEKNLGEVREPMDEDGITQQ